MEKQQIRPDRDDYDDEMLAFLRQSLKDVDEGRTIPAREAIASLGKRRSRAETCDHGEPDPKS